MIIVLDEDAFEVPLQGSGDAQRRLQRRGVPALVHTHEGPRGSQSSSSGVSAFQDDYSGYSAECKRL